MALRLSSTQISALLLASLANASLHASEQPVQIQMSDGSSELSYNIINFIGPIKSETLSSSSAQTLRNSEDKARQALEALGYYQPSIQAEVQGGEGDERLLLKVRAGLPVLLREVTIQLEGEARQLPAFRLPESPQLQPGAVLNHGIYEDARKLISNQALQFGFFAGKFVSRELVIDPENRVADIRLIYDSGPRYHFGPVRFSGDLQLEAAFLQRLQPLKPGEPYSADRLGELNRALQSSGYFGEIRVDASPEHAQGLEIPVQVQLSQRLPRSLAIGLGYSTDVGPRLKGSQTRHWQGSAGHSWGSEFELSAPRQNLEAWYAIPLDPPLTDTLRFTTGYQHEQLVDTNSTQLTLGTQWQQKLESQWVRTLSLRLEQEQYSVGEDEGNSSLLLPGLSFSRTQSDSKVDPNHGWSLQASLAAAERGLLSDTSLLHAQLQGRWLTTFDNGHRLLARSQLGSIATDDFAAIPPSLRFFTGGDQSVRGFNYQTLSPLDDKGERVGGRNLIVGSLEYQYPLQEKWRLATFVDHGNAVDSLSEPLRTGVGMGVRWVSPVGPLRLDIARGLPSAVDDGGWQLHFSIGPEL